MSHDPVIEAAGLRKTFGDFTAVDGIDFSVERGSICAFLGANGSGKSTTIRMLIGLLPPTEGSAIVDGIDVVRFRRRVRDHIGYMSQRVSLYATLSLRENLEFYGGLYGLNGGVLEHRWDALSDRFDLRTAEHELASDLPAGIRQRAGLAFSMLHQPRVLFLDEPTAGVDVQNRLLFWDIIQEEAEAGVTVFVTTHFLEEVEYCDWACFIEAGRLIANGKPDDIRARFSDGYRISIAVSPETRSYVATSLAAVAPAATETDTGVELHAPRLSSEVTSTLRSLCAPHGPGHLRIEPPDMTDVFRRLMSADADAAPVVGQRPVSATPQHTARQAVPRSLPVDQPRPRSNRWQRIATLMLREIRATLRDRTTVAMLLGVPVAALIAFGSIVSTEVHDLPLAYHDASRTPESRRLIADLGATGTFRLSEYPTRSTVQHALVAGAVNSALIIPPDFARAFGAAGNAARPPEVQVLYDGAETVLAGNAEAALQSMLARTGAQLMVTTSPLRAAADSRGAPQTRGPRVAIRALFNPDFNGVPFMVAGTFGFVLTFLTTLITAVSIINERISGTFEQLQVTPATSAEIVLGKILPLGGVFVVDVTLMILVGGLLLDVWPAGSTALFIAVSTFYVLVSLALGLIISATSATAAAAVQKTVLFSIPLIFLGGFLFPLRNMPIAVQWLAEAFPATHYIRISRAIYLRAQGIETLMGELATIAAIGVLLIGLAFRTVEART